MALKHNHDFPSLPLRAFIKINGRLSTLESGGGDPPPPPDYTGAANATAAGNLEAARIAASANRTNQYGPGGSIVYSPSKDAFDQAGYDTALKQYQDIGGVPGGYDEPNRAKFTNPDKWDVTTSLSPDQQQIYNNKAQADIGLGSLALQGIDQAKGVLSNPNLDLSGVVGRQIDPGQTAQDAIMARLNPQMDRQREQLRTQLLNQGIGMGNEAYRGAMTDQNQRENDLMSQAAAQGININQQARAQGIQEQQTLQDRPLNLINALRSGQQVQGPQFQPVAQQATTSGANLSQAADSLFNSQMSKYNSGVAQSNATTGGLFNLAGSLGGAAVSKDWSK